MPRVGKELWKLTDMLNVDQQQITQYLFCNAIKASRVQFTHEMTLQRITVHPKLLCEHVNHRWPVMKGCIRHRSRVIIVTVLSSEYFVRGLGRHGDHREGQGTSKELE